MYVEKGRRLFMNRIELKVKGMVCGGCENRVKNALSTIDGVESVEASFKTGIVTVTTNKELDKSLLEDKIDDIGFEVVK